MEGDGGASFPRGAGGRRRDDRLGGTRGGRAAEAADPHGDPATHGAGERPVGLGEATGDEHGDRQVRDEHRRPVRVGGGVHRVVVVAARRQRQVQGELPGGEDTRESDGRLRPCPERGRDGDDHEPHRERRRARRDDAAGLPVRGDPEDRGAGTEQHGTRRRRSVGGHGPPR
ncbi:hypothetical protein EV188_102702 [Actinomycetospora succinea]|uniref:Uncharacterized protein n=1 Tax=Actinomycetospora succinea TaxID=663603 RepID=A0A4R6VM40_9PSEU|nr:hypothetical protein [Actinomycetospora succinea]TDQ63045.1 hypothetical protein EV188_102702 [Actinomycetospora succinea]